MENSVNGISVHLRDMIKGYGMNKTIFADEPSPLVAGYTISGDCLSKYKDAWTIIEGTTFFVCRKGTLKVTINHNEYLIRESDYLTLLGKSYIRLHELSPDVEFSYVWFTPEVLYEGEFYRREFKSLLLVYENPVKHLSDELRNYIEKAISVWQLIKDVPEIAGNREIIKNIMNACLHVSLNLYGVDEPEEQLASLSKNSHINREFTKLVVAHYRTERRISFYADKIGTTKENLCRIVRNGSQMTPLGIMNTLLIFDAKTQLKFTRNSITEIGFSLGFPNLAAFCRFFHKYAGISPTDFRNS